MGDILHFQQWLAENITASTLEIVDQINANNLSTRAQWLDIFMQVGAVHIAKIIQDHLHEEDTLPSFEAVTAAGRMPMVECLYGMKRTDMDTTVDIFQAILLAHRAGDAAKWLYGRCFIEELHEVSSLSNPA